MINAGLAQGKGRPGGIWFLIVLLPRQLVDPNLQMGGRRPRPFERLDWTGLTIVVALIILPAIVLVASGSR